jgi:hypothetical protein
MALANVAVLMAQWGHQVLAVDWDLEAPGLDRYFEDLVPGSAKSVIDRDGIVEIATALSENRKVGWKDSVVTFQIPGMRQPLDFISAGRRDSGYARRLQQLDWEMLFQRHDFGGRLEAIRKDWLKTYDYVLIDSRTGITDIGGICTIYLPDVLVALFTANHQSVEGVADVFNRARRARSTLPVDRGALTCVPVPARDESRNEYEQSLEWRREYDRLLAQFYTDFLPREVSAADALDLLRIPNVPYWSFGERLPVLTESPSDPSGITYYYTILARLLATGLSWRESAPPPGFPPKDVHEGDSAQVASGEGRGVVSAGRDIYISQYWRGRTPTSAYLEQVQDLAPKNLVGRDDELAELAAFCDGDAQYIWWQGAPWTGKTALMSWFVLHPPPSADLVSFFVSARLAGQADSSAFAETLLEQLALLLGLDVPTFASSLTREAHLRQILRSAAGSAEEVDRKLVLVVDGLDEDQSQFSQSRLPSIASLLPVDAPSALRVIVAGRPHPPLPTDVPDNHPLRACPIRILAPSAYAEVLKRSARDELRDLLTGSEVQQQVVGYLTASPVGLSGKDLEALTGLPPYQIELIIDGVAGRSISRRRPPPGPDSHEDYAYSLAHDALLAEATSAIGQNLLEKYKQRIFALLFEHALDNDRHVRRAAVQALAAGWPNHQEILALLRNLAAADHDGDVRRAAVQALAADWADDPATLALLRDLAAADHDRDVRRAAVQALAADRPSEPLN